MADFSPELPLRCGSESDSELSQSLARIKTRSYGSTASAAAPLGEKYVEHRVADGDTLQGIALKYGVTMEQIKRANKLFSNDCIFLRHSLSIPVRTERPSLFNGLSLESPDSESTTPQGSPCVSQSVEDVPQDPQDHPSPPDPNTRPPQAEELSAKDYLHMLDLQIKRSKQAARKLKEEDSREDDDPTLQHRLIRRYNTHLITCLRPAKTVASTFRPLLHPVLR
ncbi:lysM and putative peptidoglycan-binding domain-containing protein 2 [Pygocentrus nattereri]|uniref:LysM and putative peptidoglycan-binding domain-containing protein 2 n=1 Tax=Pygocentrus nattereri TaxID=42514 RepID=A0A3B4EBI4_PYGNA|nr:lysM and putative peptidoglycan-binding domain-containing protein 2 [Pygocentrus nattereri]